MTDLLTISAARDIEAERWARKGYRLVPSAPSTRARVARRP
jgi:hypothetical protein